MRGMVMEAASESTIGVIRGENAALYRYTLPDLRGAEPEPGQEVLFDISPEHARNIHVVAAPSEQARLRQRDWVAFYLSPRGRISRKDYWLYGVLIVLLTQLLIALLFTSDNASLVGAMLSLVLGWAGIALSFKRFQDRGYSGWWSLLPYGLLLATTALVFTGAFGLPGTVLGSALTRFGFVIAAAALLSALWAYLWVPLWRGERGYNRFGPDPLETGA